MNSAPITRSPAPRVNADNRAEVIRNKTSHTIDRAGPEANFAAVYVAPRYDLALPPARVVSGLASLGRAFG
jgi:hypothetical protein